MPLVGCPMINEAHPFHGSHITGQAPSNLRNVYIVSTLMTRQQLGTQTYSRRAQAARAPEGAHEPGDTMATHDHGTSDLTATRRRTLL